MHNLKLRKVTRYEKKLQNNIFVIYLKIWFLAFYILKYYCICFTLLVIINLIFGRIKKRNIKVFCRFRPLFQFEKNSNVPSVSLSQNSNVPSVRLMSQENIAKWTPYAATGSRPLCLRSGSGEGSRPRKETNTCSQLQACISFNPTKLKPTEN
jgi:hypothetical protein